VGTAMQKIVRFIKECAAEMKKVVWPNKTDVVSSIKVVLLSTLIVAVILGLLDLLFVTGMNKIF
jgi:preprotein translocase subunit SecE